MNCSGAIIPIVFDIMEALHLKELVTSGKGVSANLIEALLQNLHKKSFKKLISQVENRLVEKL